jgi:hypothetical protein
MPPMTRFVWQPLLALVALALPLLAPASARADLVYALDRGSLGGQSSFGTVTLTQIVPSTSVDASGTIHVEVNLLTPTPAEVVFAKTGAGKALTWNLQGVSNVSITNITDGFGIEKPGTQGYKASPYGNFGYAISCLTGCGNGTSPPKNGGPLAFDITGDGLTLDSFVANIYKGAEVFFTADLGVNGKTGVVGTSGAGVCQLGCGPVEPGDNAVVPEPASLLLLGTAALLLVPALRRRG